MQPMPSEMAETVALEALAWLVSQEELLPVFLGASGAGLEDLKSGAGDPATLASVLDFLLLDDRWVRDFAAASGRSPDALLRARAAMPGAEQVHWT